jgi:hypothetical protein
MDENEYDVTVESESHAVENDGPVDCEGHVLEQAYDTVESEYEWVDDADAKGKQTYCL